MRWCTAIGAIVLAAGCSHEPAPFMAPLPPYVEREFLRLVKQNNWTISAEKTDEEKKAIRELLTLYRTNAESMPPDPESEALLREVAAYYRQSLIDIWMCCRDAAQECEDPAVTPRQMLGGWVECLRPLGRPPLTSSLPRRFVVVYSDRRRDGKSHRQAIDEIAKLKLIGD